jgi:hypothetical protein
MKFNKENERIALYGTVILGILTLIGWIIICINEPAAAAEVLKAAVTH